METKTNSKMKYANQQGNKKPAILADSLESRDNPSRPALTTNYSLTEDEKFVNTTSRPRFFGQEPRTRGESNPGGSVVKADLGPSRAHGIIIIA